MSRLLTLMFLLSMCFDATAQAVTGGTISPKELSVEVGGTANVTGGVIPADADDKGVWFTSDNEAVATVNSSGVITAIANGTVIINVVTADGGHTDSATVTVGTGVSEAPVIVDVTGITISPKAITAKVGEDKFVTGAVIPANASEKLLWFTSSDESVATVNASGRIAAIGVGSATITTHSVFGNGQFTDSMQLTVEPTDFPEFDEDIDLSQFDLSWSDEFDYPDEQLEENWISQNAATGGFVLCSRWRENAVVENGTLKLLAKKETRAGEDWTCGNLWTKQTFQYGYYEARYRYAAASGTNNSFWLWPKNGPVEGYKQFELDINEGHYPNEINTNAHNWADITTDSDGNSTHPQDPQPRKFVGEDFSRDFHTYGFLWTENKFKYYLDGELIRVLTTEEKVSPANILLSLAVLDFGIAGDVTDAIDGTFMEVDFVRHYTAKTDASSSDASENSSASVSSEIAETSSSSTPVSSSAPASSETSSSAPAQSSSSATSSSANESGGGSSGGAISVLHLIVLLGGVFFLALTRACLPRR